MAENILQTTIKRLITLINILRMNEPRGASFTPARNRANFAEPVEQQQGDESEITRSAQEKETRELKEERERGEKGTKGVKKEN